MLVKLAFRFAMTSPISALLANGKISMGFSKTCPFCCFKVRNCRNLSAMIVIEQIVSLHKCMLIKVGCHIQTNLTHINRFQDRGCEGLTPSCSLFYS